MGITITFLLLAGLTAKASAECNGCLVEGKCVETGTSYTNDKCEVYTCPAEGRIPELTGFQCYVDGVCRPDGYIQKDGDNPCVQRKCVVSRKANGFTASLQINNVECNMNGVCKRHGENWTEGCTIRKCVVTDNYSLIDNAEVQCNVNGVCKKHEETWTEGCTVRKCVVKTDYSYVDNAEFKCDVDGVCRKNGETWTNNCITKKCVATTDFSYSETIDIKCDVNGVCKSHGETWAENCFDFKCVVNGKSYRTEPAGAKCADKNGICRSNSDPPFPYVIGDRTFNCRCNASITPSGRHTASYYGCQL